MYIGIIAPTLERKHSPTKQRFELYHHVNTLSEYEKMCTVPLRDYRRLSIAVISVYFSVFSPLFTQFFCCICCPSQCFNLFVRNTVTLLTVYLSGFSLLKRSEERRVGKECRS